MKRKISIIFGGKSAEHQVSLNSASNIFNAVDLEKFDPVLLGVDKSGRWFFNPDYPTSNVDLRKLDYFQNAHPIILESNQGVTNIIDRKSDAVLGSFEVAFSIIHGTFGEDGVIQGFFKSKAIPFVGPDVLGSSICMDKDITKRLLRDSGIPIADFITVHSENQADINFEDAKNRLGLPLFIKPCNAGSSVGVSKATDETSFQNALAEAFRFDRKVLIEEAIVGQELECAVLGNENPQPSIIGEIVATKDFYSYDAKYVDADGAKLIIPGKIDESNADMLRKSAVEAFKATCCEGLARVDFFLKEDNSFVVNEINTIPGFTEISMYPKLWEATGISYSDLITKLIDLAMERHQTNSRLETKM
jgi:D-alanine-D-alanine ligase